MTQYIYIALIVSIVYLLLKLILEKYNKEASNDTKDKHIFRDSIYVGIIVFVVLYGYEYYYSQSSTKTKVFTNEPDF